MKYLYQIVVDTPRARQYNRHTFCGKIVIGDKLSRFADLLERGEFVITTDITSSTGVDTSGISSQLASVEHLVDAVILGFRNDYNLATPNPIGLIPTILGHGFDAILNVECRDRNRLALQSDLFAASILGIENIMCVTGDMFIGNEYGDIETVFDVGSTDLIHIASNLSNGIDVIGSHIDNTPKFYVGGMVNPFASELADDIIRMKDKVEAGAKVFITQPFFDIDRLEEFRAAIGSIQAKVISSIVVLDAVDRAKRMNNIPGIEIPQNIIMEIESSAEHKSKGIDIAARTINKAKAIYDGVHIINLGLIDVVRLVLEKSGIKRSSLK